MKVKDTLKSVGEEFELLDRQETKKASSSSDAWRVLRIQSEIVDGFEHMRSVGAAVSIFGSARTAPESETSQLAETLAKKFAEKGISVITGGGPGVMEAANKGAQAGKGGKSIGLNIELPMEQSPNPHQDLALEFRYFFVRKLMFIRYSLGYVYLPGGFGTLDELFDVVTLIQTKKIERGPIVLVGKKHWEPFLAWVRTTLVNGKLISEKDLSLFTVTDDCDSAVEKIMDEARSRKLI